jgi:hypothetical protein
MPQRESYGPTEVEKLDIYRTKRPNAPIFVFISDPERGLACAHAHARAREKSLKNFAPDPLCSSCAVVPPNLMPVGRDTQECPTLGKMVCGPAFPLGDAAPACRGKSQGQAGNH